MGESAESPRATSKQRPPVPSPFGDMAESVGPLSPGAPPEPIAPPASRPTGPPSPERTWEGMFLAIVNNTAKPGRAGLRSGERPGPVRSRGFLVVTHGSASLQRVQALCHQTDQRYNTCLTARYTVRPPVLGNLLAALVIDLARLTQRPGAAGPVGDLLPATTGLSSPPWATLRSGPFPDLAARAGLARDAGELPADWVTELFQALGGLLPTGVRLVLFAEVEGATRTGDCARIDAAGSA